MTEDLTLADLLAEVADGITNMQVTAINARSYVASDQRKCIRYLTDLEGELGAWSRYIRKAVRGE